MSIYHSVGGTPGVVSLAVGAFVAWAVAKYYADKGKYLKALGWTPLGISRIVTRPVADVAKGLALTWNGEPLQTPYAAMIHISNVGTRAVIGGRPKEGNSDYQMPLKVSLGNSTCYQATITRANEVAIDLPFTVVSKPAKHFEVLMPTLNVSSWIELEIIADGTAKYPDLDCLLVDQKVSIRPVAGRQRSAIKAAMLMACGIGLFLLTIGFGLLGLFAYNPEGPGLGPPVIMAIGGSVTVLAGLGYAYVWVLDRQEWNAMKRGMPGMFATRNSD